MIKQAVILASVAVSAAWWMNLIAWGWSSSYYLLMHMQVHSGGLLQATPHYVAAAEAVGVSRNTFAVFMQPRYGRTMSTPSILATLSGAHD